NGGETWPQAGPIYGNVWRRKSHKLATFRHPALHRATTELAKTYESLLRVGETSQRFQSLAVSDASLADCVPQPFHGLIVDLAIHGIGMSVLATVCKAESGGIAHARR